MMTLADYLATTGTLGTAVYMRAGVREMYTPSTSVLAHADAYIVPDVAPLDSLGSFVSLWHLADWKVSSVQAGSVWLLPRQ
jgi:hypothetical protein